MSLRTEGIADIEGDRATFSTFGNLKPEEAGKMLDFFDGENVIPAGNSLPDAFFESLDCIKFRLN